MSSIRIATRYAKSLLELAVEQGKLEQVYTDLNFLQSATKNREFALVLKSPIIKPDKKTALLESIFGGKIDVLTMTYLRLLVSKNREMHLPEIVDEFTAQYKRLKKITSICVVTATPMSADVMNDLRNKLLASDLTSDNVEIETKIDPTLIGGFVLEFDNKRYDASVAHKLEQMKKEFTKNLYVKEF